MARKYQDSEDYLKRTAGASLAIIRKEWVVISLFIFSLMFFFIQKQGDISYDFTAYVDNARYFRGDRYFESVRPPVAPIIIMIFSLLGWGLAEYLYIASVSALFLYSTIRIAKAYKIDHSLMYAALMTPYLLIYGVRYGTELLSLSFLMLFLSYKKEGSPLGGLFLGLACLTRYNLLLFAALIVLDRDIRRVILSLGLFFVSFIPWFIYTFMRTGNWFTYIIDSYYLSVAQRGYAFGLPDPMHFIIALNYLIPLSIFGLYMLIRKRSSSHDTIVMSMFTVISFFQYLTIPMKDQRFLFTMVLPFAYFAARSIGKETKAVRKMAAGLAITAMLLSTSYLFLMEKNRPDKYIDAISYLESEDMSGCKIYSNEWPILNYYHVFSVPYPREEMIKETIDKGGAILLFYSSGEPPYMRNITGQFPDAVLHRTHDYVLLGGPDGCAISWEAYDMTYIETLHDYVQDKYNSSINTNPCFIAFSHIPPAEMACNLVNFRGFTLDSNRESA